MWKWNWVSVAYSLNTGHSERNQKKTSFFQKVFSWYNLMLYKFCYINCIEIYSCKLFHHILKKLLTLSLEKWDDQIKYSMTQVTHILNLTWRFAGDFIQNLIQDHSWQTNRDYAPFEKDVISCSQKNTQKMTMLIGSYFRFLLVSNKLSFK